MRSGVIERRLLIVGGASLFVVGGLAELIAWIALYPPLGVAANEGALFCALLWVFLSDALAEKR